MMHLRVQLVLLAARAHYWFILNSLLARNPWSLFGGLLFRLIPQFVYIARVAQSQVQKSGTSSCWTSCCWWLLSLLICQDLSALEAVKIPPILISSANSLDMQLNRYIFRMSFAKLVLRRYERNWMKKLCIQQHFLVSLTLNLACHKTFWFIMIFCSHSVTLMI